MTTSKTDLLRAQRRWADVQGVRYDARGCVRDLNDNLRAPLTAGALVEFGRGSELTRGVSRPARMLSLCSSAALVANVFGYWHGRDALPLVQALGLGDRAGARLSFEEPLPTGLAGDPPMADVALRWPDGSCVAIESKFAEWLERRPRNKSALKDKYFPAGEGVWLAAGLPLCQAFADDLQAGRERPRFLHAAQLLKHALGLAKGGARPTGLVYLYYDWPGRERDAHRGELERVLARVVPELDLRVLTYQELYRSLCATDGVDADYLGYLAARYFR